MPLIRLYTTPVCPFCHAAKRLLNQAGYPYEEVDVAGNPELRQQLSAANGNYRTVPMIFIGEEFIGGFQELASLQKSGELATRLNDAAT